MPIRLTWTDNSTNETGFTLSRETLAADGVTWGALTTFNVGSNISSFDDPMTTPGTYRYRIQAYNATGASSWTPYAQAVIPQPIPAAPSNLVATLI